MEKKSFNTGPAIFLIAYHVILLITLPLYFYYATINWGTVLASVILFYLTGISITAGYHRFFSHRAYRAHPIIESILLFFGSMAGQGSALRWSFDHRLHHAHVDTDEDPYSIKKGFWYAHMLWLFDKPREIDPKIVPDLIKNKGIQFQHKHFPLLMVITNAIAWAFVGMITNDYWGAFFLAVWTRFFVLHHFTWFINSLAHTWGEKPFSEEHTAVDNYFLSLVTFGEGYHNYHHTFANDYRNGIRWFHFDPTKWLIWTLSKIGLAHGLRRTDPYTIKRRMVLEKKILLTDRLKQLWDEKKGALEKEVHELADSMIEKMSAISQLKQKYIQFKEDRVEKEILQPLRKELKALEKSIRYDWRSWSKLSRTIMRLQ